MGRYTAGRYVDYAGQQLAGDFIHVGDHQQKALRSGKGGGQRTALQRAVYGTGSAGLRLHFHNFYLLAEQVFLSICRPFVRHFRHYGRRRDGVNRSNVGKGVRCVRRSVVTIHGLHFSCHSVIPPLNFCILAGAVFAFDLLANQIKCIKDFTLSILSLSPACVNKKTRNFADCLQFHKETAAFSAVLPPILCHRASYPLSPRACRSISSTTMS